MSYTPPLATAANFAFSSSAGYVPPAGNAVTLAFSSTGDGGGGPSALVAQGAAAVSLTGLAVASVAAAPLAAVAAVELAAVTQVATAGASALRAAAQALVAALVGAGAVVAPPLTEPNFPDAMKPTKFNLDVYQGADYDRTLTFKVGDPAGPADLTGCTARAQIRSSVASKTVLLELTTENARIVLGGPAGTITLAMSATDTAGLPPGDLVYDLELVYPSGRVRRLLYGTVCVSPEVTRA